MNSFTPAQVEHLTGWSVDGQRDLRRKGFWEHYGVLGENGRWRYSSRDIAALWLASELHRNESSHGLQELFAQCYTNSAGLLRLFQGKAAERFVAIIYDSPRISGVGGYTVKRIQDLSWLAKRGFDEAVVIDLQHLADTAPEDIRMALLEAAGTDD